jgi:SPASM domain peptide maturase of grasp-with-spasm system
MTANSEKRFMLMADCIPIRGYGRGIIYDLGRSTYKFVPNSVIDFVGNANCKTQEEILSFYHADKEVALEYLKFLSENEFSVWIDEQLQSCFPSLDLNWDYPGEISNAIIDFAENIHYSVDDLLKSLENLGCKHLQLRSFSQKPIAFFDNLLENIVDSQFLSVEILTKFSNENMEVVRKLVKENKRLKSIIFHTAPANIIENVIDNYYFGNIAQTRQSITSALDCNNISRHYFTVSIPLFSESQKHNTYFNRKICIDGNGDFKSSSHFATSYGNVLTLSAEEAISAKGFKNLWDINKDMIDVCKECEFRHMCVDSCTPKQREDGTWYRFKECSYNPYICKWHDEPGYSSLADCGVKVTDSRFTIDREKIDQINNRLWA